jgi:CxxC motif-containing protein (DUF1111 family)
LFRHEWISSDPLSPGGDGLGPVYNAKSCVACHYRNGAGGSGGLEENVTVYTVLPLRSGERAREGVVHAHSTLSREENLRDVHSDLPAVARPTLNMVLSRLRPSHLPPGVQLSHRNTPALFGANLIDNIPEQAIVDNEKQQRVRWESTGKAEESPHGRALHLADGKVGRFGWKGQSATLASFVQAACANELGLGNSGQAQPKPLFQPEYKTPGNDLTDAQCAQLTAFVASLPRPSETPSDESVSAGKRLFASVGCAECHTPHMGGVAGLYSDLLLHHMGPDLAGGGSYNFRPEVPTPSAPEPKLAATDEWRTPPLWGVADSPPYLHDGRAATLEEAIQLHGGESAHSTRLFTQLSTPDQVRLVAFLKTLRAPSEPK